MKLKPSNLIFVAAASCLFVFGGTMAFLKDNDSKQNTIKIGNIGLSLSETNWTDGEKKAVSGQIFLKNPVLTNNGANDEYVFLEVLMPMDKVQMLYEGDVYSDNNNNYAIKIGNVFYQAVEETDGTYTNRGTVIADTNLQAAYNTLVCESGTKKGDKKEQEIFRTLTNSSTERLTAGGYDFCYNGGNENTGGWVFLEAGKVEEENYMRYLFGYNRKLLGNISNTSNTDDKTVPLFDKVQLKSFIDEDLLGEQKENGTSDKDRYESKAEEIKVNAFGIQSDNLNLSLENDTLTEGQLEQIYEIARQKME